MPSRSFGVTGTCETAPDARLRLVVTGHVDHGKSTLIGRLFHDTGSLPEGRYDQLVAIARRRGVPFEWANLTDALQAERDQNVTIDTAQIWFRAGGRQYVIIDAPGHKEFLKNMVTGAARADAAIILVDAAEGVQEQTRRHAYLLTLLGISQVVVAVNKMDLVDYEQTAFAAVRDESLDFLAGVGLAPLAVVPIAAREGDNVAVRGERLSWFDGPTLLGSLDLFTAGPSLAEKPLRFPVQDVYRFDHRRVIAGRLESGTVQVGDRVVLLPGGEESRVRSIERWNTRGRDHARAGESIGITLSEPLFVERGAVAVSVHEPPAVGTEFYARVFWLGRRPLQRGRSYAIKLTTQECPCEVVRVDRIVDGATLEVIERPGLAIGRNEIGEVIIRTARPVVLDAYDRVPPLGRFVLVDDLDVAGGGIVLAPCAQIPALAEPAAMLVRSVGQVGREERHLRNGHRGAVVWFTGLSGSGKSTLANILERTLFDRGMQVFVLDGDNVRFGLNADLGFTAEHRVENIRRVAEVAKLFAEAGFVTLTAFISPYRSDRLRARRIMEEGGLEIPFLEVFLDATVEQCAARDPKGLYARARTGEIRNFTGVSAPYETPEQPALTLATAEQSIDACVGEILDVLLPRLRPTAARTIEEEQVATS